MGDADLARTRLTWLSTVRSARTERYPLDTREREAADLPLGHAAWDGAVDATHEQAPRLLRPMTLPLCLEVVIETAPRNEETALQRGF